MAACCSVCRLDGLFTREHRALFCSVCLSLRVPPLERTLAWTVRRGLCGEGQPLRTRSRASRQGVLGVPSRPHLEGRVSPTAQMPQVFAKGCHACSMTMQHSFRVGQARVHSVTDSYRLWDPEEARFLCQPSGGITANVYVDLTLCQAWLCVL